MISVSNGMFSWSRILIMYLCGVEGLKNPKMAANMAAKMITEVHFTIHILYLLHSTVHKKWTPTHLGGGGFSVENDHSKQVC